MEAAVKSSAVRYLESLKLKMEELMRTGDIIEHKQGANAGNGGKENRSNWFSNAPDVDDIVERCVRNREQGMTWVDACCGERYPANTIQHYIKRHKLAKEYR